MSETLILVPIIAAGIGALIGAMLGYREGRASASVEIALALARTCTRRDAPPQPARGGDE